MVESVAKRPIVIKREGHELNKKMKAFAQAIPNPRRGKRQKI